MIQSASSSQTRGFFSNNVNMNQMKTRLCSTYICDCSWEHFFFKGSKRGRPKQNSSVGEWVAALTPVSHLLSPCPSCAPQPKTMKRDPRFQVAGAVCSGLDKRATREVCPLHQTQVSLLGQGQVSPSCSLVFVGEVPTSEHRCLHLILSHPMFGARKHRV